VARPVVPVIVPLLGLVSVSVNVSSGSKLVSPLTGTPTVVCRSPAGIVAVPWVAV